MSIEHDYLKNIAVVPTAGQVTNNELSVTFASTLITTQNLDTISVYYNGQQIQEYVAGETLTFAKYYYTYTNNNAPWAGTPVTGIEGSCSITFYIFANQDFVTAGYTNADAIQIANFSETDIFYISFYYSVMKDV
jgi:hypothetical protein